MKTKRIRLLIAVLASVFAVFSFFYRNKENIILTRFGTTQWDLYQSYYKYGITSKDSSTNFKRVGVYELSWNNECYYYIFNNRKQKLQRYEADDVITSKTWKYENDSTFMLNGYAYKTLSFGHDSIVLLWNNPNWLDTLILVRSQKKYYK